MLQTFRHEHRAANMKRRLSISLFILLGIVLCGLALLALRPTEPSYQGRPISAWLDDMTTKGPTDYYKAIENIGTNALPYAVRNLGRNDSKWRKKYRELWPKFPKFLKQFLPQPKQNLQVVHGANVFSSIGPDAISQAITLLKHDSSTVRQAAAWGLGSLRRKSTAVNQAIPALIETLRDPDRSVRFFATLTLKEMGADASNAVPALAKIVGDNGVGTDQHSRAAAAYALGKIGPTARNALPALKKALQEPSSYLRGQVAVAIWRIDSDAETTLPVLLQEMPRTIEDSKWDWIIAVGEMGPRAKEAIPQLTNELKQDKKVWIREHIINALIKIDPEAAAKIDAHPLPEMKFE